MSEITEQEAREAVERISKAIDDEASGVADGDTAMQIYGTSDIELAVECGKRDLRKVVEFARQELARREAERAELDQSIDAEWCVANGAVQLGQHFVFWRITDSHAVNVYLRPSDQCVAYGQCAMPSIATRRQLLDLLRALKGGAT